VYELLSVAVAVLYGLLLGSCGFEYPLQTQLKSKRLMTRGRKLNLRTQRHSIGIW